MTVSKHTPGPWFVDGVNYDDAISIGAIDPRDGKRFRVAGVHGIDDHCVHCHQSEANARLVAAAPELLEALQEAKAALEWCVEQGGGPVCEHESGGVNCFCKENNAIDAARAAIAKATGVE